MYLPDRSYTVESTVPIPGKDAVRAGDLGTVQNIDGVGPKRPTPSSELLLCPGVHHLGVLFVGRVVPRMAVLPRKSVTGFRLNPLLGL